MISFVGMLCAALPLGIVSVMASLFFVQSNLDFVVWRIGVLALWIFNFFVASSSGSPKCCLTLDLCLLCYFMT